MVSNRRMGMSGFIEHAAYGLVFLALLVFLGLPFAMASSTHWAISFFIYMITFGNIMYISSSLAAYGKCMLTESNFDVDIGEMYDILSNVKVFKIIFMVVPLALIGAILSPIALITMIFNLKTFFKTEKEYLDKTEKEWEDREQAWDLETQEMKKKEKEKNIYNKIEENTQKKKFVEEKFDKEPISSKETAKKEKVREIKKTEVGYVRCYINDWDSNIKIVIYHDGETYVSSYGAWKNTFTSNTFEEMVQKIRTFYKNNSKFKILEKYEK